MGCVARALVSDTPDPNDFSENISIIYGGSVKPDSASEIFGKNDVDGGLIGGASLNAEDFIEIVNSI